MDLEPLSPADDHDPTPWLHGHEAPALTPDDAALAEGPLAGGPLAGGPPPGGPPTQPRFSRKTRIAAGALALVTVGAAAWAAGTTIHSSSVHLEPAAATSAAGGTSGATGKVRGPGGGMGGVTGTVGSKGTSSFDVSVAGPGRRFGPGAAGPSGTSGTSGEAPATAVPTTATVDVSGAVTYTKITSTTGPLTGLAGGTRIIAVGSRNLDGSLQATGLTVLPASPAGSPAVTPRVRTHNPADAPGGTSGATGPSGTSGATSGPKLRPHLAAGGGSAPFVAGTVNADSSSGVLTVTTPWGTETVDTGSGTTVTETVPATYADVVPGARVLVTGSRDATTHTVTATHVLIIPAGMKTFGPGGMGFFGGPRGFAGFARPGIAGGSAGPGMGHGYGRFHGPGAPTGSSGSSGSGTSAAATSAVI